MRAFFPPRSRVLVGVALLVVTVGLTGGYAWSLRSPIETLAWFEQNRAPGDSAAYASAVYHASFASAAQRERWRPTGYATLGLVGLFASVSLIASARYRRES